MTANNVVAAAFRSCAPTMIGFLRIRSATTPPHSENTTAGAMNATITRTKSIADPVMS